MASHSEAMRNVAPPLQPLRPSLWGRIRAMRAEEAAVSRALGHKPQPPFWVGIVVSSAATLVWAAVYFGG